MAEIIPFKNVEPKPKNRIVALWNYAGSIMSGKEDPVVGLFVLFREPMRKWAKKFLRQIGGLVKKAYPKMEENGIHGTMFLETPEKAVIEFDAQSLNAVTEALRLSKNNPEDFVGVKSTFSLRINADGDFLLKFNLDQYNVTDAVDEEMANPKLGLEMRQGSAELFSQNVTQKKLS